MICKRNLFVNFVKVLECAATLTQSCITTFEKGLGGKSTQSSSLDIAHTKGNARQTLGNSCIHRRRVVDPSLHTQHGPILDSGKLGADC